MKNTDPAFYARRSNRAGILGIQGTRILIPWRPGQTELREIAADGTTLSGKRVVLALLYHKMSRTAKVLWKKRCGIPQRSRSCFVSLLHTSPADRAGALPVFVVCTRRVFHTYGLPRRRRYASGKTSLRMHTTGRRHARPTQRLRKSRTPPAEKLGGKPCACTCNAGVCAECR